MEQIGWNVLLSFGTIVGLFFTLGKPILSLNTTISKLISRMSEVEDRVDEMSIKNTDSHRRIHERIDKHEDKLVKMDNDITKITTTLKIKG